MDRTKTIHRQEMLILGIFTNNGLTAITGSVEQANGQIEKDAIGVVASDVFQATAMALTDAAVIRAGGVKIYTNDTKLVDFLTPPIRVKPTEATFVKGHGYVPSGGDPNQWQILYKLFVCGRWQIQRVSKLPGTEAIYHEYCKSNAAAGQRHTGIIQGGFRRLYEGVWTSA